MTSISRQGMTAALICFLLSIFGIGATATTAQADVPFWVQADLDKAKSKAKSKSAQAAKANKSTAVAVAKKKTKIYASAKAKPGKVKVAQKRKKLGGYAEKTEPVVKKKKGVKVAALGRSFLPPSEPKESVTGKGGVRWVANGGCLDAGLKAVVYEVAANFGPVTVSSTCRGKSHNRKVGGAPKSKHLTGDAVDFRVHGKWGGVYAFLRGKGYVGGVKHYGGGLFHADNGDKRTW